MEINYGIISADDHVQEPFDLWTTRLPKPAWGDRIPHLEEKRDGSQVWVVDGTTLTMRGVASVGAIMPDRNLEPQRWDEVPPSAYKPLERLGAMDADGVDYQVLYPTVAGVSGEIVGAINDAELELECVQAYNDWIIEDWAGCSPRFVAQCLIPISSPAAAAAEARRSVAKGHKGIVMPATPWNLKDVPHINDPSWDSLWQACQELDVPICFHSGSSSKVRLQAWKGFTPNLAAAMDGISGPVSSVPILANLLFSQILTRFPNLRFVFAEASLAWGAYLLETADHQFERQRLHSEGYELKPSEIFGRNCYMTGWYDRAGLIVRKYLGVENILWESNFPQANSTWPNTRDFVQRSFANIPTADRSKILVDNAAKLYKL